MQKYYEGDFIYKTMRHEKWKVEDCKKCLLCLAKRGMSGMMPPMNILWWKELVHCAHAFFASKIINAQFQINN